MAIRSSPRLLLKGHLKAIGINERGYLDLIMTIRSSPRLLLKGHLKAIGINERGYLDLI
jgi:hypothetical protein